MQIHARWIAVTAVSAAAVVGSWIATAVSAPPRAVVTLADRIDSPAPPNPPTSSVPMQEKPWVGTGLEALPASLQDTEVAGQLEEDAQGKLKITRDVRSVFDYFLSLTGTEPLSTIRARLVAYAKSRLKPPAAAQAVALFDSYIAYKDQLQAQLGATRATSMDDVKQRLLAVRTLRGRTLPAEVVTAFFGDDDAYDQYSMDRSAIMTDRSLSPKERAKRLAELHAKLPQAAREQIGALEMVQTLDEVTADWRERKGNPEELRKLRETIAGKPAADRLEILDRETSVWDSRVASYLQQRADVQKDPSLADSTRKNQIEALRQKSFGNDEQVRIETLERIHDSSARDAAPISR